MCQKSLLAARMHNALVRKSTTVVVFHHFRTCYRLLNVQTIGLRKGWNRNWVSLKYRATTWSSSRGNNNLTWLCPAFRNFRTMYFDSGRNERNFTMVLTIYISGKNFWKRNCLCRWQGMIWKYHLKMKKYNRFIVFLN